MDHQHDRRHRAAGLDRLESGHELPRRRPDQGPELPLRQFLDREHKRARHDRGHTPGIPECEQPRLCLPALGRNHRLGRRSPAPVRGIDLRLHPKRQVPHRLHQHRLGTRRQPRDPLRTPPGLLHRRGHPLRALQPPHALCRQRWRSLGNRLSGLVRGRESRHLRGQHA